MEAWKARCADQHLRSHLHSIRDDISAFPILPPVTGENMNYALPIFAFVVVVTLLLWIFYAKKNWGGLNAEIVDYVLAHSDQKEKDAPL